MWKGGWIYESDKIIARLEFALTLGLEFLKNDQNKDYSDWTPIIGASNTLCQVDLEKFHITE